MTTDELFKKYPYYLHPAITALPQAEGEERRKLLRRLAAGIGPETALRTLVGVDPEEFRDFYGESQDVAPDTDETINEFLTRFGADEPSVTMPPADGEAAVPVAAPVMDYATAMLGDTDDAADMPQDDTSDLLNSFLKNDNSGHQTQPAAEEIIEDTEVEIMEEENEEESDDSREPVTSSESEPLSEALVKIMVKNGNYRKALEIITDLNLNNPKKSIYFADQIRFLNKLIQMQEGAKTAK